MSSPPREGSVSSSPITVRGGSPLRRRDSVLDGDLSRPRLSPTLVRSFDPNDPEVRERQRRMDVDMAMQLSRARRETITNASPSSSYEGPNPDEEPPYASLNALSPHEQHEIDIARGDTSHFEAGIEDPDTDSLLTRRPPSTIDLQTHLQHTQDPSLLVSINGPVSQDRPSSPSGPGFGGLPTYQANASRTHFDFSPMEEFAAEEKANLGIGSVPTLRFEAPLSQPSSSSQAPVDSGAQLDTNVPDSPSRSIRQRRLSQSTSQPRSHRKGIGGKLALFEGHTGEPPPSLPGRLGLSLANDRPNRPPFLDEPPRPSSSVPAFTTSGMGNLNTGHDRPYRFSFYSNALPATIHARSLSELPAEGQSFEDLFTGISGPDSTFHNPPASDPNKRSSIHRPFQPSYFSKPPPPEKPTRMSGGMIGASESDGTTWWLDIQNPTDEEMRMLSKVFNIHPLTTEDIQMEETREKIELFRNYYLVCFRSFDQDPYSPTHLEPLNMYIIVFREGTLSFHFRPTPHPQNVRRRIKQLKDYISVTSDWISYALIDDITDAFGPLIQSIEYEVDSIDELVLILKEAEQSDMLRRIGRCRKKVMGLLRLMGNKADVVKGLAKRCNENWQVAPTSDIGLYLSDIQDHLITMTQNLNHYEKILSRSHSNYLAQISIEMTDANNQINDVLSKLTALGTVLIPMNLVTGLWGMNVHVPGEDDEDSYIWFASIIACLVAFAVIGGVSAYKFMTRR